MFRTLLISIILCLATILSGQQINTLSDSFYNLFTENYTGYFDGDCILLEDRDRIQHNEIYISDEVLIHITNGVKRAYIIVADSMTVIAGVSVRAVKAYGYGSNHTYVFTYNDYYTYKVYVESMCLQCRITSYMLYGICQK